MAAEMFEKLTSLFSSNLSIKAEEDEEEEEEEEVMFLFQFIQLYSTIRIFEYVYIFNANFLFLQRTLLTQQPLSRRSAPSPTVPRSKPNLTSATTGCRAKTRPRKPVSRKFLISITVWITVLLVTSSRYDDGLNDPVSFYLM